MTLLLRKPRPCTIDRRPRRSSRRQKGHCGRKFESAVAPATTTGNAYSEAELVVRDTLDKLGFRWGHEDVAIQILKTGRKNGRLGWKVFAFRVDTVFIEVSTDHALDKVSAVNFVRNRYRLAVIHLTPELAEDIADHPEILRKLIDEATKLQSAAGTCRFRADILEAAATTARRRAKRLNGKKRRTNRKTLSGIPPHPATQGLAFQASQRAARAA